MRKVLIVVDMQKDFISGSLGSKQAEAILPYVCEKVDEANKNNVDVICTMDTHNKDDYFNTVEGSSFPMHCIMNTDGWKIHENIRNKKYSIVLKNSFMASKIALPYDTGEIEIVGLVTDICVISNALYLRSKYPCVKITVDAKGCAGVTSESHINALSAMKMCQINVVNENT